GERLDRYAAGAAYWWQNTRATVLFEPAARRMLEDGYTHFVELGPHPVLASSIIEIAGTQSTEHRAEVVVMASQRRDDDDAHTLMNCVGALHSHGHAVAWDELYPRGGARLLKLPTYPWQSKRFWNETQEAVEDLHYNPVHPLLGQPVSAVHPTWETELSITAAPFLGDHRVQGSTIVPGAVFIEMALAAAQEAYGSTDHCVENLVLKRALILDETCDPVLRTTLNQDTGSLEFAAFTATADGDVKWTVTATAELKTLPNWSARNDIPQDAELITTLSGEEFYARTESIGFAYGEAFQSVSKVRCGDGWAEAQLTVRPTIAEEISRFRFHPALIDGAFQTLFGANSVGQDAADSPLLPTRIRQSVIYGSPQGNMTAHVHVVSATKERIESDITITDDFGEVLAAFHGFTVESLTASSRMSPERIDKGLYDIQWVPREDSQPDEEHVPGDSSWLVLLDNAGAGTALVAQLRARGQRVQTVVHRDVSALTRTDGGYAVDPRRPGQLRELLKAHLDSEGDLAGVVDYWPLDLDAVAETKDEIGVFAVLHLVQTIADLDTATPRLYLITANAQPAPGTGNLAVDQATLWGLGRVIGHQEFAHQWGALIDIDAADDLIQTAGHICDHLLANDPEDQLAIRANAVFVPRLRPCANLTKPFPTKLTQDATYVVTGGAGALGRTVAAYLAERGARHIALLSRSEFPPRDRWPTLAEDSSHYAAVGTIRTIERLGAQVITASVDITDADEVESWLSNHTRAGGRPVRGIVHAAGSVADQLLVNMGEADFVKVMAPKVNGTRVLHNAFAGGDLEFFVMFGSAGSVVASPGQGNYAAANAFLDAFAHYRQAQGLPALTIGWGPWSVGMVEELKLEKLYAQRGIELITPGAGARILDRLINQKVANVVAISADWKRARSAGLGAALPPMFSDLGTADTSADASDSDASILDYLSGIAEADRLSVVVDHVRQIAATVFDIAATDIGVDDTLNDIGLDSMMAMDFRVRINTMFAIDLPVLELLRGVSINSLAVRVLAELPGSEVHTDQSAEPEAPADGDVERMLAQLSEAELRAL
ncbi:MAG: SDR family NAD(P)-dependent oxidoreductase, partial [Mycobacteriaceae bacterium]|nr:SDR family NAD(P)-dependent oxidoreductase [Mycobacteriaceae bacterium]